MTETNAFLAHQEKVMAQREALQREAKTIPVGTKAENEPGEPAPQAKQIFDPNAPVTLTKTWKDENGNIQTSERTITYAQPEVRRIAKAPIRPIEAIKADLVSIGDKLDEADEAYHRDVQSLDLDYRDEDKLRLRLELADLQRQVAEKTAALNELESKPAPAATYVDVVASAERDLAGYALELLTALSEGQAKRVHGVSLARLSKTAQRDCQLRYLDILSKFRLTGNYTQIGRQIELAGRRAAAAVTADQA